MAHIVTLIEKITQNPSRRKWIESLLKGVSDMKQTKEHFKKEFESLNGYYLDINNEVYYFNLEADTMQIGVVTNAGFCPTCEIEIDYDFSFDENLLDLIESFKESELI